MQVFGNHTNMELYQWCEPRTLRQLYISLVQPHLEYAAPVWDPYTVKDVQQIEGAQKFALRVCMKDWSSSYDNLLEQSDLNKLSMRRNYLSLCHLYRLSQQQCIHPDALLSLYQNSHHTRSQGQNMYERLQARTNVFYSSFFPRAIREWNSLPPTVTSSQTLASFKRNLCNFIT